MNLIYLVWESDIYHDYLQGVFSTKERAETFCHKQGLYTNYFTAIRIEAVELDCYDILGATQTWHLEERKEK